MKKNLLVLSALVVFFAVGLPVSAKTYSKIELLTIVLNNIYDGSGTFTEQTCDLNTETPTIEITFNDIDVTGAVVSASISDGIVAYDSAGTIKKKAGNSFYTVKLNGTYTDASADYTVALKGRISKTTPTVIRKVTVSSVIDLNEDFSVDTCAVAMTFKKLNAQ